MEEGKYIREVRSWPEGLYTAPHSSVGLHWTPGDFLESTWSPGTFFLVGAQPNYDINFTWNPPGLQATLLAIGYLSRPKMIPKIN